MAIVHSSRMSNETKSKPNASPQDETPKIDESNNNTNGGSHGPPPPAASPLNEVNEGKLLNTMSAAAANKVKGKQGEATKASVTTGKIPAKEQQITLPPSQQKPASTASTASTAVAAAAATSSASTSIASQQQQQQTRIIPITSTPSSLTSSVAPVKVGTTTVIGVSVPIRSSNGMNKSTSPRPGKPLIISGPTVSASRRTPVITSKGATKVASSTVSHPSTKTPPIISTKAAVTASKTPAKLSLLESKENDKDVSIQKASHAKSSSSSSNSGSMNVTSSGTSSKSKGSKPLSPNAEVNDTNSVKRSKAVTSSQVGASPPSSLMSSSSKMPPTSSATPSMKNSSIGKGSKKASSINSDKNSNDTGISKAASVYSKTSTQHVIKKTLPQSLSPPPAGNNQSAAMNPKSASMESILTIDVAPAAATAATATTTSQVKKVSNECDNLQQGLSQQQNLKTTLEPSSDFMPRPLINTDMKQIITDILILLQTYGPLTVHQIEYNLPPYPTLDSSQSTSLSIAAITESSTSEAVSASTSGSLTSSSPEYRFKIIQDVLDVLSVIQVIHKTKITNTSTADESSSSTTSASMPKSKNQFGSDSESGNGKGDRIQNQKDKIVYFFNNGKVRGDVIYPWEIMDMIRDANDEINESADRIELLKKELGVVGDNNIRSTEIKVQTPAKSGRKRKIDKLNAMSTAANQPIAITPIVASSIPPSQRMKTTREFLKVILCKYPDVVYDPVYNAALRNFNVDLGAVARERERYSNLMSGGGSTTGGRRGSSSKTNTGDGDSTKKGSGNNMQGASSKRKHSSSAQSSSSGKKKRARKNSFAKATEVNSNSKGNAGKKESSKLLNGRAKAKNLNQTKKSHVKLSNSTSTTLPTSGKPPDPEETSGTQNEKESLLAKIDKNENHKEKKMLVGENKVEGTVPSTQQNKISEKKGHPISETSSIMKKEGIIEEKKSITAVEGRDEKKQPPRAEPLATQVPPKPGEKDVKSANPNNVVQDKAG